MFLFFDTETTGFPSDSLPADHPNQAHICQLGALLQSENERVVGELNVLIKPEGWEIPSRVSEIHGITTPMCEQFGIPLRTAISLFAHLTSKAQLIVAHNYTFDHKMIALAGRRIGLDDHLLGKHQTFCTMLATTEICRLPKARGAGYKWPKLTEAYFHFFRQELDCAHDAMADVRGCKEVYWAVKRGEQFKQGEDNNITVQDSPL
jgi:DNA polymerase-3 subunit epsilon